MPTATELLAPTKRLVLLQLTIPLVRIERGATQGMRHTQGPIGTAEPRTRPPEAPSPRSTGWLSHGHRPASPAINTVTCLGVTEAIAAAHMPGPERAFGDRRPKWVGSAITDRSEVTRDHLRQRASRRAQDHRQARGPSRARSTPCQLRMRLGVSGRQYRAGHARDPNPPGCGARSYPAASGTADQASLQDHPALTLTLPGCPVDGPALWRLWSPTMWSSAEVSRCGAHGPSGEWCGRWMACRWLGGWRRPRTPSPPTPSRCWTP
jgi:hypothetical protein